MSPIWPTGPSQNDINQSEYVIVMSNQTCLCITTQFRRHWRVFGKLLSDFLSTSPKNDDFSPQISPILPSGPSQNDINQSDYVIVMSNQTFLRITTHFGRHRRVFGKLLSDFWSTGHKNDDFWPQISPILPTGTSKNEVNQSQYVIAMSNQT